MVSDPLKLNLDVSDIDFDSIYPQEIREIGKQIWTPVEVAKVAAQYLTKEPEANVLDIGSGVGKFCTIGAAYTKGQFTGVEQRPLLIDIANGIKSKYRIENVKFIQANITDISFEEYNSFYFFNSFYENMDRTALLDSSIETGISFYKIYTRYVYGQLAKKPVGTTLVTYWSQPEQVPDSYQLQLATFSGNLKLFKKMS